MITISVKRYLQNVCLKKGGLANVYLTPNFLVVFVCLCVRVCLSVDARVKSDVTSKPKEKMNGKNLEKNRIKEKHLFNIFNLSKSSLEMKRTTANEAK